MEDQYLVSKGEEFLALEERYRPIHEQEDLRRVLVIGILRSQ